MRPLGLVSVLVGVLGWGPHLSAQSTVDLEKVTVVQDGSCTGVRSTIKRYVKGDDDLRIRDTDSYGILVLSPPMEIENSAEIYAKPMDDVNFHNSFNAQVERIVELGVVRRTRNETSEDSLVMYVWLSGILAGEGNRRERVYSQCDRVMEQAYAYRAYDVVGELLGVQGAAEYDVDEDRVVPSQALKDEIGKYQMDMNLVITGTLNLDTLDALSKGRFYRSLIWDVYSSYHWEPYWAPQGNEGVLKEYMDGFREEELDSIIWKEFREMMGNGNWGMPGIVRTGAGQFGESWMEWRFR